MKIQKINTIKINNNKQHQKISFGENKVENVFKDNKQPKKNKIYEYTRDALALWGVILTIYAGYFTFVIKRKMEKLKI